MKTALVVDVVINHAAPIVCMNVPMSDTKSAINKLRNSATRSGRHGESAADVSR